MDTTHQLPLVEVDPLFPTQHSSSPTFRIIKFKVPPGHLQPDPTEIKEGLECISSQSEMEETTNDPEDSGMANDMDEPGMVDILSPEQLSGTETMVTPIPKRPKRNVGPPSQPIFSSFNKGTKIGVSGSGKAHSKNKQLTAKKAMKKSLPVVTQSTPKKEKHAIRIQEMPGYISDMRAFVQDMKAIRLRPWNFVKAELHNVGTDPVDPVGEPAFLTIQHNTNIAPRYNSSSVPSNGAILASPSSEKEPSHVHLLDQSLLPSRLDPVIQAPSYDERFLVHVWVRSDGTVLAKRKESGNKRISTIVDREKEKEVRPIYLARTPLSPSTEPSGESLIRLLSALLKTIPATSEAGYFCKIPKCGKNFIEKEKYRRHLHNHVRTIKHQQARSLRDS